MKGNPFLILEVVMLLLVSACINQELVTLEDTLWKLDLYEDHRGNLLSLIPDTEITAHFRGGIVSGSCVCTAYSGKYEVNGSTITMSNLSMILTDCWPEKANNQNCNYLIALASAKSYEIHGNIMAMTNADGKTILVFSTHKKNENKNKDYSSLKTPFTLFYFDIRWIIPNHVF